MLFLKAIKPHGLTYFVVFVSILFLSTQNAKSQGFGRFDLNVFSNPDGTCDFRDSEDSDYLTCEKTEENGFSFIEINFTNLVQASKPPSCLAQTIGLFRHKAKILSVTTESIVLGYKDLFFLFDKADDDENSSVLITVQCSYLF